MLRPPTSESSSNETTSSSTLPFSSSNQHRESITSTLSKTGTWNSHANHKSDTLINSKNSMNHYSSQGSIFANQSTHITNPLDNVPFVPNPTFDSVRNGFRGSSSSLASGSGDPLTRSFMAVERIGQFLATPSSSEYQFSEERRQLKESRASNGWTLLDWFFKNDDDSHPVLEAHTRDILLKRRDLQFILNYHFLQVLSWVIASWSHRKYTIILWLFNVDHYDYIDMNTICIYTDRPWTPWMSWKESPFTLFISKLHRKWFISRRKSSSASSSWRSFSLSFSFWSNNQLLGLS